MGHTQMVLNHYHQHLNFRIKNQLSKDERHYLNETLV